MTSSSGYQPIYWDAQWFFWFMEIADISAPEHTIMFTSLSS